MKNYYFQEVDKENVDAPDTTNIVVFICTTSIEIKADLSNSSCLNMKTATEAYL